MALAVSLPVRAPLQSVSHPNWLTAAPWNGPPSTLSALSLADSRKTLALGLLLWDVNGAWRWHLVPGYLGGPFYDKGGGAAPGSNPLSPRLRMTPLRGHQIKWSFHAGMGELKGQFAVPIRQPSFSGAAEGSVREPLWGPGGGSESSGSGSVISRVGP